MSIRILIILLILTSKIKAQDTIPSITESCKFFTSNNLNCYKTAIDYWNNLNHNYIKHFPKELDTLNLNYEIQFSPHVGQNGSKLYLKIQFKNKRKAKQFYEKIKDSEANFASLDEIKKSWHCYPNKLKFKSGYKLSKSTSFKLIYPTWCVGQGDRKIGGITSGIALDKKAKTVLCWANDAR